MSSQASANKPPVPPFTAETANQKVKAAQNAWNTKYVYRKPRRIASNRIRNPAVVKNAYTEDCIWRNRDHFFQGHEAIVAFLTKKWEKENGYRLRKELFAFSNDKVSTSLIPKVSMRSMGNIPLAGILYR